MSRPAQCRLWPCPLVSTETGSYPPSPFPAAIIRDIGHSSEKWKLWASPKGFFISCNFDFSQSSLACLPFAISSEAAAGSRRLCLLTLVMEKRNADAWEWSAGRKVSFVPFISKFSLVFHFPIIPDVCRAFTHIGIRHGLTAPKMAPQHFVKTGHASL